MRLARDVRGRLLPSGIRGRLNFCVGRSPETREKRLPQRVTGIACPLHSVLLGDLCITTVDGRIVQYYA